MWTEGIRFGFKPGVHILSITLNGVNDARLFRFMLQNIREKAIQDDQQFLLLFILVFNQLKAQNLFYSKFYFTPLHVSSTCAHHQEVKNVLHSLWYHHTYRCDDTRGCVMQF